jgi:hypothetical protein
MKNAKVIHGNILKALKRKLHTINKTWAHIMIETINTLPKHARKTMDHSQMNYLHAFFNYLANTREKRNLQYSINSRKIIAAPICPN